MNFITNIVGEKGITDIIYNIRSKSSYNDCMTELKEKLKNRNTHYLTRCDRNGYILWINDIGYDTFIEELDNNRIIPYYDDTLKYYTKFDVFKFENYIFSNNKKTKIVTIDDYTVQHLLNSAATTLSHREYIQQRLN